MSEILGSVFGNTPTQDTKRIMLAQALMQPAQPVPPAGPYNIEDGPDFNKWDEALQQHGTIRLPKERDNPQEWLSRPQFEDILKDVDRRDLPDGSVILSKKAFTS